MPYTKDGWNWRTHTKGNKPVTKKALYESPYMRYLNSQTHRDREHSGGCHRLEGGRNGRLHFNNIDSVMQEEEALGSGCRTLSLQLTVGQWDWKCCWEGTFHSKCSYTIKSKTNKQTNKKTPKPCKVPLLHHRQISKTFCLLFFLRSFSPYGLQCVFSQT